MRTGASGMNAKVPGWEKKGLVLIDAGASIAELATIKCMFFIQ